MAIDLNKMKQKSNQLKAKSSGAGSSNVQYWKPQEGENVIRVVPTADGDPFKEFWLHYNIGGESGFLCPNKNYGESCAICDFVKSVYRDKSSSEEDKKQASTLSAKQRFYTPVIDRNAEEEGVKIYSYSKKVYEALLGLVLNPEYGDIADPKDGLDLVVTHGKTDPKQLYAMSTVLPRRKSSALCSNKEMQQKFLEHNIDFTGLFTKKTGAEVQAILDKHFSSAEDSESEKYGSGEDEDVEKLSEQLKNFK